MKKGSRWPRNLGQGHSNFTHEHNKVGGSLGQSGRKIYIHCTCTCDIWWTDGHIVIELSALTVYR